MTKQFTSDEIKSFLRHLCALGPDLGLGDRPRWLRLECNALAEKRHGDRATIFDVIGVKADDMQSVFGPRWLLQFNEHKPLRAVFNKEFKDRRFCVREFNMSKFIAVLGPTDKSVPDESNAIERGCPGARLSSVEIITQQSKSRNDKKYKGSATQTTLRQKTTKPKFELFQRQLICQWPKSNLVASE